MPKLEFRRRVGLIHEVVKNQSRLRDGTINELLETQTKKHGANTIDYLGHYLDLAHYFHPGHEFFTSTKQKTSDIGVILSTLSRFGPKKRAKLKQAILIDLNMRAEEGKKSPKGKRQFTPERRERIEAMVDSLYKNQFKIRKDALLDFQKEWNSNRPKEEHVSYEALKKDLTALAGAYLPVDGRSAKEEHFHSHLRADFLRAKTFKESKKGPNKKKADEVARAFIDHSAELDMRRLSRETVFRRGQGVHKGLREEIIDHQQAIANAMEELYVLRISEPGVHPVTASNSIWRELGVQIHSVLPAVKSMVYDLFEIAEKKTAGQELELYSYDVPFNPGMRNLLAHLENKYGITPQQKGESGRDYEKRKHKKAATEVKLALDAYRTKAYATLFYEKGRHALAGGKGYKRQIEWGNPLLFGSLNNELKKEVIGKRMLFGTPEAEAGRHLFDADALWTSYKKKVSKNPFLPGEEKK